MKCSKCGFENSDNSKFCINCASSLSNSTKKICPACKYENPNIAKFCQNCATDLTLNASFLQNTSIFSNNNSTREEELRRELERLRLRSQIYPEKKKSNKKWIAIGIIILFVIALPSAYFIWFRSFQTQTQRITEIPTQGYVQQTSQSALGSGIQILSVSDDGSKYYFVIKNTYSNNYVTINSSSFKRDGNGAISSNPSSANINVGESKTFAFTPNGVLTRGKTHTFTITGYTPSGEQTVIVTTYTDS
jgi:hypothetical protein